MKFSKILVAFITYFAFTNSYAAPTLYEFSVSSFLEVRGDPAQDTFYGVNNNQTLFASGTVLSGSFLYDPDTPVTEISPDIGLSFGSITNFTAYIDGYQITDPASATLMQNDTNYGNEDFFGTFAESPVNSPVQVPRDINGFDISDGEGQLFSLFNVRSNFLQGVYDDILQQKVLTNDFISDPLQNPAVLPPPGFNGASNVALDFLEVYPDGSLNESIEQIVFFGDGYLRPASVPEPGTLFLMVIGLSGFSIVRRCKKT